VWAPGAAPFADASAPGSLADLTTALEELRFSVEALRAETARELAELRAFAIEASRPPLAELERKLESEIALRKQELAGAIEAERCARQRDVAELCAALGISVPGQQPSPETPHWARAPSELHGHWLKTFERPCTVGGEPAAAAPSCTAGNLLAASSCTSPSPWTNGILDAVAQELDRREENHAHLHATVKERVGQLERLISGDSADQHTRDLEVAKDTNMVDFARPPLAPSSSCSSVDSDILSCSPETDTGAHGPAQGLVGVAQPFPTAIRSPSFSSLGSGANFLNLGPDDAPTEGLPRKSSHHGVAVADAKKEAAPAESRRTSVLMQRKMPLLQLSPPCSPSRMDPEPTPQFAAPSIASPSRPRTEPVPAVMFMVSCCQTRLGLHVRVVGGCRALGYWNPVNGMPLHTSASEFPLWRSSAAIHLEGDASIEYKYVICSSSGGEVQWETRPNRSLHLSAAIAQGHCPRCSEVIVTEFFDADDEPAANRFKHASMWGPALEASMMTPRRSASKIALLDRDNLYAPTIRHRSDSVSPLSPPVAPGDLGGRLSLIFGGLSSTASAAASPLVTGATTPRPAELHEPLQAGQMAREESCSNLYIKTCGEEEALGDAFLSRYSLMGEGPLGEGTFGLVWRCSARAAEEVGREELAAKIVRKTRLRARDVDHLLGANGEVRTHLALRHPLIVRLFEYFNEEHMVTLVLEYCKGGDLFDAIMQETRAGKSGFAEPAAATVAWHLLSALEYLHGNFVVHRDLKCENVLLTQANVPPERNTYKLCDFGFATKDHGEGLTDRLGSPDSVAPEVVAGKRYSFKVDCWSTGVLIYMMCAAYSPFAAPTDTEVLRRVLAGKYCMSGGQWDFVSSQAKSMIASLMNPDPEFRPRAQEALRHEWLRLAPTRNDA